MEKKKFWGLMLRGLAALLAATVFTGTHAFAAGKAKNVIVLIVDGCSAEQYTFARWFKGKPLSFDPIRVGAVQTYIADSVVANSASAATAFATGVRTSNKLISVGPHERTLSCVPTPPEELRYRPLATVLEGARLLKKATGVVATCEVTHATPAAYMAHVPARTMEDDIMEQAVYLGVDVVLGGGKRRLLPADADGKRADGENLLAVLEKMGYRIAETREQMMKIGSGKVFGLFAQSHMDAEIDREELHPEQPTLKEMTQKAIELLSRDPDGFFLMVEASQVDWACQANDPGYLLSDLLAYDSAVETALDFAKKDGNTLVLALSDHNTGGFSIGNYATSFSFSEMKLEAFIDPFRRMKASTSTLWSRIENEKTPRKVEEVIREGWGMDITGEDAAKILSLAEIYKRSPHYAIGEILSARYTFAGWSTHGHCGGDVPLHAFGPGKPCGVLEAPEIGRVCAEALGLDLAKVTERIFADAALALPEAKVAVDQTDGNNPVIRIEYQGKKAELPVNKNLLKTGSGTEILEGVAVFAPNTGRVYLPVQAVRSIRGSLEPLPAITN